MGSLVLGCWLLTLAACVSDTPPTCQLDRACDVCTLDECAWCEETAVCQRPSAFCPGEVAYRPDQCEAAADPPVTSSP